MRLQIWLPDGVVAAVDEARGDVPRSRFIRRLIERALADPEARERFGHQRAEIKRSVQRLEAPKASEPRPKGQALSREYRGCSDHPHAGAELNRDKWWCAEPGCTRLAQHL